MNPNELLRIVDAIHRDKNIDKSIVFDGIESALVSAAKKHYGEDQEIVITIDRSTGQIHGTHDGTELTPETIAERIGAQTAKQVMIQKIREAERDALYDEYMEQMDQLVTGVIHRYDGGAATVTLGNIEAILPRGEQIPGETHHVNERIRATVCDVRKVGSRVKVILSRTRKHLVARLFEQEIPEIIDGVIEIKAVAREPGYRTKVAVSSSDQRVDCVGACVGVRGNRIKNIVDELSGERVDIVRFSDDMQVMIPNALQPAEVEEVILCKALGRAIVLVREDQLSLAIGRRGQNVRLGSKLCIWDIEIMTQDELNEQLESAIVGFSELDGMDEELADKLVGEGFLSYDDLSVIEPDVLMEMGSLTAEQVDHIVTQADDKAMAAEQEAAEQRRRQREKERRSTAMAQAEEAEAVADAARMAEMEKQGEPVVAGEDVEVKAEEAPAETQEAPSQEAPSEEIQPEEIQTEEVQTEEVQTEEIQPEEIQPEEVQTEDVQTTADSESKEVQGEGGE